MSDFITNGYDLRGIRRLRVNDEDYYDKRIRERREAKEAEKKKSAEQLSPQRAAAWDHWWNAELDRSGLHRAIGECIGEQHLEALDRFDPKIAALEKENAELRSRIDAIDEVSEMLRTRLDALEARLMVYVDRRINEHVRQTNDRLARQSDAIAKARQDWRDEIKNVAETARRSFDAELGTLVAALEQRVKEAPGRFPQARPWRSGAVTYQGELVTCGGSTFQAARDTAQEPGDGNDWIVIALAGKPGGNGISPTVRGSYDATVRYRELDIVTHQGSGFIARRDNPGECPGGGWLMIARQGRQGAVGPMGAKGEPGARGTAPTLHSAQIDRATYRMTLLFDDGSSWEPLEFRPFLEQFLIDRGEY